MNENMMNHLAYHIIVVWLLIQGFQPSGEWDESSPECVRHSGEHIIWTVQATVQRDVNTLMLSDSLYMYLQCIGDTSGIHFQVYDLEIYHPSYSDGEIAHHLYASIYI